jgi:hypothetical protein
MWDIEKSRKKVERTHIVSPLIRVEDIEAGSLPNSSWSIATLCKFWDNDQIYSQIDHPSSIDKMHIAHFQHHGGDRRISAHMNRHILDMSGQVED